MRSQITPTLAICMAGALLMVGLLFVPARDFPAPASGGSSTEVSIEGFTFSATSGLQAGQTVLVTNNDSVEHTLTATNGSFGTGLLQPGEQAIITLPNDPGNYEFSCEIHPSMTGTFQVGTRG